jgi:hypothetical protein
VNIADWDTLSGNINQSQRVEQNWDIPTANGLGFGYHGSLFGPLRSMGTSKYAFVLGRPYPVDCPIQPGTERVAAAARMCRRVGMPARCKASALIPPGV